MEGKAFEENESAVRFIREDRSLDALKPNIWHLDEGSCPGMSEDSSPPHGLRNESPPDKESRPEMSESLQDKNNVLRLLYDTVISPIAVKLKGDEVLIVPEGPLCLVPFAAFVDEDSKYLSESFRIRIAPSLHSLKLIKDSPDNYHCKKGGLLVGDPCLEEMTYLDGKPKLQPLPGARREVTIIGEIIDSTPLVERMQLEKRC